MANETTVDFLNDLSNGKPEIFKEEPAAEKELDTEEKPERVSFAKDEKLQKYIDKQVERRMKDFQPSAEQQFRQEVKEEINLPPSFVKLVGNDTDEKKQVLKDLDSYFKTLKGEARQEFLQEMKEQEQAQIADDNAALEELNSGFEQIEDEYGVDLSSDTKTRAAFIEFLRKASHKNADGEVDQFADIPSTWEIFQERQKPQASRAKELASRGMTRSGDTSIAPVSGARDWKAAEKYIASLTK